MRKYIFSFIAAFLAASLPIKSIAEPVGYISDGFYSILNLQTGTIYPVGFAGISTIKGTIANACGVAEFEPPRAFQFNDKFEVKDEVSSKNYGFTFTSIIPAKATPKCEGQPLERQIWKTTRGIAISGLTPNSPQAIKYLSVSQIRKYRANTCGFIKIPLDKSQYSAFFLDGKAFEINKTANRGVWCRKEKLYLGYLVDADSGNGSNGSNGSNGGTIPTISETTWNQNNPPQYSGGTFPVIISTGGSWAASGTSVVVNPDPPTPPPEPPAPPPEPPIPPPPPPQCPSGYSGTPPNCQSPPPPPPPPPPPAPPPEPPKPKPPTGQRMCKVGSQLVVLQLQPAETYDVDVDDEIFDSFAVTDSTGRGEFNNFNWNANYEGAPANFVIYKRGNPDNPVITANVSIIQPCQN
jgi:hypothetical protein